MFKERLYQVGCGPSLYAVVQLCHHAVCRQIDAAIVRIMKSRKTLSHTSVMSELFTQLRFPAEVQSLVAPLVSNDRSSLTGHVGATWTAEPNQEADRELAGPRVPGA